MKVTHAFSFSGKDSAGNLHHYKSELTVDVPTDGDTNEQKLVKVRATQAFLHNEIHKAIKAAAEADGVPFTIQHNDYAPVSPG